MKNIKSSKIKKIYISSKGFSILDLTYEDSFFLIKIFPFFLILLLLGVGIFYSYKNKKLLEKYESLAQISQQVLKYDLLSETSPTKYVGKNISIGENYVPKIYVFESKYIIGQANLTIEAGESFLSLATGFYENFGKPIKVVSSYRSYQYQNNLNKKNPLTLQQGFRANAGESEHQLGLAIDIFEASNVENFYKNKTLFGYRTWLQENAHNYGFTQSYKFGADIDGYNIEPWHRRYVGTGLATELYKKNMTFSQYYKIFY